MFTNPSPYVMTRAHYTTWLVALLLLATPGSLFADDPAPADTSATAALHDTGSIDWPDERLHHALDPWDDRAQRQVGAFAGDLKGPWPFRRERALYPSTPAVRYNRVEGAVVGVQRHPMRWGSDDRHRLYGQVGYASALKRLRYAAGFEVRADQHAEANYGLKIGALYRHNTATNDAWKTSWLENSLGASLFNTDVFDYHDVQGWTFYTTHRFTRYAQLTTGFRTEDYSSLQQETTWSLFGGDRFTDNPAIDDGRYKAFVVALEAGRVADFKTNPHGAALRVDAEFGQGLDNPIPYNRYQADARAYLPVTPFSTLGLRLRGGYSTANAPLQKQFTIGGIGSMRGYTQNGFAGPRTLIGNAEYIIDDVALFDNAFNDLALIGFVDAGWAGDAGTRFTFDDVRPAAGFGIGLDDRTFRIDFAWPLRPLDGNSGPSIQLRISPTF